MTAKEQILKFILEHPDCCTDVIQEATRFSDSTVRKAVRRLEKERLIIVSNRGKKQAGMRWLYRIFDGESNFDTESNRDIKTQEDVVLVLGLAQTFNGKLVICDSKNNYYLKQNATIEVYNGKQWINGIMTGKHNERTFEFIYSSKRYEIPLYLKTRFVLDQVDWIMGVEWDIYFSE